MAPGTFCQYFSPHHHHLALLTATQNKATTLDDTEWLLTCKKTLATDSERKWSFLFFNAHNSRTNRSTIDFQVCSVWLNHVLATWISVFILLNEVQSVLKHVP